MPVAADWDGGRGASPPLAPGKLPPQRSRDPLSNIVLSDEQQELYDNIDRFIGDPFAGDVYHYDGLAGTGKSVVLAKAGQNNPGCMMVALSGRAASLLHQKSGLSTSTIHAAIYKLMREIEFDNGKRQMEWRSAHNDGALSGVTFLLDEKSMIGHRIARDILRTGARIVAAGDPGQLPPIQDQQYFVNPDFTLRQIHRQALESPIVRQAHRVRAGERYQNDGSNFRVVDRLPRDELMQADMVLCWKNTTRVEITKVIRSMKGLAKNYPRAGEFVMCLKNAPDYGLFNGAVYTLTRDFNNGDNVIWLDYEGEEIYVPNVKFEGMVNTVPVGDVVTTSFTFGYVYTVHKAQGSEAKSVVLVDEYAMPDFAIEWRYTAITRAQERITIIPH
jgi:exodeoxyribonuclease-5